MRHGLMLVGPTGGGKSSNLHVLEETLSRLKQMGKEVFGTIFFTTVYPVLLFPSRSCSLYTVAAYGSEVFVAVAYAIHTTVRLTDTLTPVDDACWVLYCGSEGPSSPALVQNEISTSR